MSVTTTNNNCTTCHGLIVYSVLAVTKMHYSWKKKSGIGASLVVSLTIQHVLTSAVCQLLLAVGGSLEFGSRGGGGGRHSRNIGGFSKMLSLCFVFFLFVGFFQKVFRGRKFQGRRKP